MDIYKGRPLIIAVSSSTGFDVSEYARIHITLTDCNTKQDVFTFVCKNISETGGVAIIPPNKLKGLSGSYYMGVVAEDGNVLWPMSSPSKITIN